MHETEVVVVAAARAGVTKKPGTKRVTKTMAIVVVAVTALRPVLIRVCERCLINTFVRTVA
jgi:hypothetical protein